MFQQAKESLQTILQMMVENPKFRVWAIVLIVAVINALTFTIARILLKHNGTLGGNLDVSVNVNADDTAPMPVDDMLTIMLPGCLGRSLESFEFMNDTLCGTVADLEFSPMGWDISATVAKVRRLITARKPRQIAVCTISVGDRVARYLEANYEFAHTDAIEMKVFAFNPCPNRDALIRPLRVVVPPFAFLMEVFCHAIGWLSVIPIIPSTGKWYTLILTADQLWTVAFDMPPHKTGCTAGVIISRPKEKDTDGLIDNGYVRGYYNAHDYRCFSARTTKRPFRLDGTHVPCVEIHTGHGATARQGDKYLEAFMQLMRLYEEADAPGQPEHVEEPLKAPEQPEVPEWMGSFDSLY